MGATKSKLPLAKYTKGTQGSYLLKGKLADKRKKSLHNVVPKLLTLWKHDTHSQFSG